MLHVTVLHLAQNLQIRVHSFIHSFIHSLIISHCFQFHLGVVNCEAWIQLICDMVCCFSIVEHCWISLLFLLL